MTKNINFKKYSSLKIGREVEVFVIEDFNYPKDRYLIGSANNILLGDNPPLLMVLSKKFDYIKLENNELIVGAATPSGKIISFCKKHNLGGFEFMSHLPGTLGGLVKMNAGLKEHEIKNIINSLNIDGQNFQKDELIFEYRKTNIKGVIFEATFKIKDGFDQEMIEIFKKMRENQPKEPSAGSFFKNPPKDSAGRLIEAVGLKGYSVGGASWSHIHANFLVNNGNATFSDAITLVKEAKRKVLEKFNIELESEVEILEETLNSPNL